MRKTTKRGEEAAVENLDGSPPKKTKLKKKEAVPAAAPKRLPRAAKNRTAAEANDVVNNLEPSVKPPRRTRQRIRRSKSSENIAPQLTSNLEKSQSKSAEHLDQAEDGPPPKKVKNLPVKTAKKAVAKKAGIEAKPKVGKKTAKEVPLGDVAEESEEEQPPLIAKKAYNRATKKAAPVETKEDKSKKRGGGKESAATVKPTRGRAKPAAADEAEEDSVVEEVKAVKGRKGRANGKKAAAVPAEKEEKEADEEDAEPAAADEVEEDSDAEEVKPAKGRKGRTNDKKAAAVPAEEEEKEADEEEDAAVVEKVTENVEEVAKPKKGGKKAAPVAKKPRNGKKTAAEPVEKDVVSQEEAAVDAVVSEPAETKPTKGNKKGKAPAAKKGGKKAPLSPKDDNPEDKEENDEVVALDDDQEAVDVPQEPQIEPEENAKSLENGESDSS